MAAITVGSVEVDVVPNTRGITAQLRGALIPAATRAGRDAGLAAGRSFGPAMQSQVGDAGLQIGQQIGEQIANRISAAVRDALRDGITQGGQTARPAAVRQGQQNGSAFARSMRASLQAALRDLPEVRLHANSTDAQREIYQIRNQLRAIQDSRIGIDISSADAVAVINRIQARLQALSASDADVQVRVDAAGAATQLAAIQAQVSRLDGQTARVDVDTSSAAANLHLLTTAAIAFGPAIIPALPVVAAGLGAIAAAGVAAAAGVGAIGLVAVPAFKGIGSALQAQKAAQDAATASTHQGGQAASQGAGKALQMAGAQQALATAHRNAARQIGQAEQGVQDAVRSAAEANARASEQVKSARRSLADAVQQAADRQRQAAEQVRSAEDSLADAQRTARQAQEDLTQARRDAALELEDLNSRLANAQLSERDAVLSVQEARDRLRAVQAAGSKATLVEQQRAQLAYDQAVQRLKDQQTETRRLTSEKSAADKSGVEGSATVRAAQERLREADDAVTQQQQALGKARQEAARQQVQSQRDIADAQLRVAEAQRNVTRTQEDGARSVARAQEQLVAAQQSAADSIASAQRQIASASQQAAGGVDQAAIAQAKYQAELAKLTPSARETFDAFVDLRSAFGSWSKSLQPKVMPIFTRALVGMRRALPGLTPFVTEAADAIGDLQDRASRGFKSPWWKTFKKDLSGSVKPAITGLGISFGNIFKGMAGVIGAFLPHMDDISGTMQRITGRFAKWGQSLKGSPEFERFLSYSSEMGPKLADALGKIGGAFLSIGQALAPVSGPLLFLLGGLAEAIGIVAQHAPWLVQGIWLAIVAMRVWTIVQWALNAAMSANPITLWIIGIVALIAIGVWAFNKFPWFRDLVMAAWNGIKTASLWLWNTILKPFFNWLGVIFVWLWQKIIKPYIGFLIAYWKLVARIAMWLWKNVLAPVFRGIGAIIVWWWNNIVKRYFGFVRGALGVLGDVFRWLWQKVIKPVWNGISAVISAAWRSSIKPAFDAVRGAVRRVSDAFETARKAIKIAWDKLKGIARTPVQYVVDVVYNNGIRGVWNKVAGAFGAKKLDKFTFASGGIMPGYTPGRDVHKFMSPTGGALELSGGEAIMRPEFTRAVGSGFVGAMNSIAKSRGAQGVKAALAPAFGGNPATPTDRSLKYASGGVHQKFADGGIFGWIGGAANKVAGAGSAAWNKIKEGASWLKDGLESSARAGVKSVVNPLLKSFPGMDTGIGRMIRKIPDRILDALFGYSKKADTKGGGGIGGPKIQAATKWAKTQNGLPYQWGGNGNPSWDCSGFMSAIESVIRGQKPHRRWSTHAFKGGTPPGWVKNGASAFKVGITHAGVGHTAGTIGKTKVESRGGDGVVVGNRARGYNSPLFTSWYGFKPGSYDSGGYLQPGLNLAYNGTGRPEPVFTTAQANALTSMAAARGASGPASFEGDLYLDSGEFLGRVRGEAQQVMQQGQRELMSAINAS